MNIEEAIEKLRGLKHSLRDEYGVEKIGVFGSVARDESDEKSDVDVVVEMPPDVYLVVHLKERLEEELKVPVDLVRYRKKMNPFLKKRIDIEARYV
ncbi:MAG: nucleotidyltransferase domain-containing protein [Planctomycetes bacterium]|nr:nucleotidyltransferase domain-containing protein [Planctomycetota bacterium]